MAEIGSEEIRSKPQEATTEKKNFPTPLDIEKKQNNIESVSMELFEIEKKIQEKTQKAEDVLIEIDKDDFDERKILNIVTPEGDWKKEKIDPKEYLTKIERLNQDLAQKNLPSETYLKNCSQAINILDRLNLQAGVEKQALEDSYYHGKNRWEIDFKMVYDNKLDEIGDKLDKIENQKSLIPFFSNRKRERLNRQKLEIETKKNNFEKTIRLKKEEQDKYYKQAEEFREKYEPVLKDYQKIRQNGILQDIKSIFAECEDFYHKLIKNEPFMDEIKKSYLQEFIINKVDDKKVKLSNEDKDKFCNVFLNFIKAHKKEKNVYQKTEEFFESQPEIFKPLMDWVRPLLEKQDEIAIQHLFARKVATNLKPMVRIGYQIGHLDEFDPYKAIDPEAYRTTWGVNSSDSFTGELARLVDDLEVKWGELDNFKFWSVLRGSNNTRNIFGDEIDRQDEIYGKEALIRSLFDEEGTYIDRLRFYPIPEAIRNLVLMAGSSENKGYQKIHANSDLLFLKNRSNWPQVLDKAIEVYPDLKNLRPILENWGNNEKWVNFHETNPEIKSVISQFALSMYEGNKSEDKDDERTSNIKSRIRELSLNCLDNEVLLNFLKEKSLLSESDVSVFQQAENILVEYSKDDTPEDIEKFRYPARFKRSLNRMLLGLAAKTDEEFNNYKNSLKRLSEIIVENKNDLNAITYLASEEIVDKLKKLDQKDIEFFLKAYQQCPVLYSSRAFRKEFCQFFEKTDPKLMLAFPQHATALMDKKMRETRSFIFANGNLLLKDISDIKFMNLFVGEFGNKSDQLIRGYKDCLADGSISSVDKELVIEFARQFRVISPFIIKSYKEAKEAGHEKVYIAQLQSLAEKMTGYGLVTDEERKKPYYKELLKHVYPNNSGRWTTYESNDSCKDRNSDLADFKIKPRYEIDLLSQNEIRVKVGEALDGVAKSNLQEPILRVAKKMGVLGHDKEKIQTALQEDIDKKFQGIIEKDELYGLDSKSITKIEEKLFLILADSIYGNGSVNRDEIKNLMITYEFATFEDISDYIAGTSDRVGRANNQDYALFCELESFYSDRIKEVNRRLIQVAWENPEIANIMPEFFKKLSQNTIIDQRKDLINKLQIHRLGDSEDFLKRLGKTLEKKRVRKYTADEIRKIVERYEGLTGGLTEKTSSSPKPETRAFYGQLRSQRERTFEALKTITGQGVDPNETHLGEINFQQALDTEANIKEGKYDEEQFASYTVQRFIDLFEDERRKIDKELTKFESLSGKQREVLHSYITKSNESAHARMVGGVCVAGDNPGSYPKENMWDMPNYFQMVFQEPETLQCQGLALLHYFKEGDKKILTATFDPSSTYLYSVDEGALFNGIIKSLEQFAIENDFDMIVTSSNKTIRTNRTGGEFEKAIEKRVAQIDQKFNFGDTKQFSYHPNYQVQEMDVIWERKKILV